MPPGRGSRLTREEVQLAVDKISRKYDEYIARFFKPPSLKLAFEERYFSALGGGADMNTFLSAEIAVIEELIRKEESRLQQVSGRPAAGRSPGFADRVLQELRERIEKYDDVAFHRQANPEIRRLVGALAHLAAYHVARFHDALRGTSFNHNSREILDLESRLQDLASGESEAPPRLRRYAALLNAFPRDYGAIDREEKTFLLEAALVLHDFRAMIADALEVFESLPQGSRDELLTVDDYLGNVITDFRLKDFNRKNF